MVIHPPSASVWLTGKESDRIMCQEPQLPLGIEGKQHLSGQSLYNIGSDSVPLVPFKCLLSALKGRIRTVTLLGTWRSQTAHTALEPVLRD